METSPQFGLIRRWWWLLLAGAALGAGAALIAVRAAPPVYRATSTLFFVSPSEASLNQSFARTYARMAVHPLVLQRVGQLLELPIPPDRLDSMISARPVPETQLVEIIVQASEAVLARDIANVAAQAFIEQQGSQLPVGPAGPSLRIGQLAVTPDEPIWVRPPLPAVALGVLLGALLAFGVAGLLEAPRPVPVPLARMAVRQPARTAVPEAAPARSIGERIGLPDVLRGVIFMAVAALVLLIPLAATGGPRLAASRAALHEVAAPTASSVEFARSPAPQIATAPPAQLGQGPTVIDLPLGTNPLSGSEPTSAGGDAEIAGATSAAPPERGAPGPPEAPAAAQPVAGSSAASPAGTAARAPYFEARFDGSQPAWPNDPAGPARFQDGAYRVTASAPGQFVGISAPFAQPLRDVVVTASFRKVGGPDGGVYGVLLRDGGPSPRDGYSQVGDFYMLGVDDRGQYCVWRHENDRWVELVPFTPSDAIRSGTQMNEIKARAVDDRLTLTVNGVDVATVLGAQARPGAVGIFVGSDSNEVLISGFQIEPATAAAESTSAPPSIAESPRTQAPEMAGVVETLLSESRSATTQAPAGFTSAFLREAPATSARALISLPNGTPIEVLPETASGDGFTWLQARTLDGLLGWIVSTAVAV